MKSNCLPGEKDTTDYCIKEGCPAGMEQGGGIAADFCYPKCAPDYESDGGSRCFKICPQGFITQGGDCIRPTHTYKKDVVPTAPGTCTKPPLQTSFLPDIPIVKGPEVVWMNPPVDIEPFEPTPTPAASPTPQNKPKGDLVWRVEDRIHINELPCPLGYTRSGDMCYENCPPNYRDTGDSCVMDRYSVSRPTYDRGSGIPFATKRSKFQQINPVSTCN
jgi:hypothetical protein